MALAGIPRRHRKYTIDNLPEDTIHLKSFQNYCSNILERVKNGQGIYLYGNTGSGKTTVLSAVAMTYIVEASKEALTSRW
jgi:DNA replication protein DnaC